MKNSYLPVISPILIENMASEWLRCKKKPFSFCIEQIDIHREVNPHFLVFIDDLLKATFEDDQELERGKAFAVICFILKLIDNQIEINDLYKIYKEDEDIE